ncbi:type II secretion system major pseudopilin GspG [Anderseniella sp. Alg231-50]|uniref:type II secretion system major pseudopilin GspG n=1 Tax=Anderseniella sp. Alg231-50 TaxID=1922226 RepID=UPI000D55E55C
MSDNSDLTHSISCRTTRRREADCKQNDAGFTIVELLVVLGIIALIAALVGPQAIKWFSKAKTDQATAQMRNVESAVELYYLDNGRYPTTEQNLDALLKAPDDQASWNGPYLRRESGIIDPWGRKYIYEFPGKVSTYDLKSLGRDGREGGTGEDGDISNSQ